MIITFTMSQNVLKSVLKSETELRCVKRWLDANKLSLNVDKTNYIIFHSPGNKLPLNNVIKIGNKHISKAKYVKFLGLLLDEHLLITFTLNLTPGILDKRTEFAKKAFIMQLSKLGMTHLLKFVSY